MSLLAAYTFTCPNNSCSELLPPSFSSCPRCGFTLSHLIIPTSLEASAKRVKHTEVIRTGSVSIGNGPGGFNASFDHVGLASIGEIIQFTVAFGHRDYISSGPGRTLSQANIAYLPETIGSGVSHFQTGLTAVSGLCIFSPASTVWGHGFPAMDAWIQSLSTTNLFECVNCHRSSPLGHVFCTTCNKELAENSLTWRDTIK